ncbi:MAG: hypothetical protein MUP70_12650 [Candidatus Aminicenantes bacterium]|nr:hypothetical protein [Candidatus Aminicenantes bacterium]
MDRAELLERLNDLGYPLFALDKTSDDTEVLAEVVKSDEPRLWEGFPILLARMLDNGGLDLADIDQYFESAKHRHQFQFLMDVSIALFRYRGLNYKLPYRASGQGFVDETNIKRFQSNFQDSEDIPYEGMRLSTSKLIEIFNHYNVQQNRSVKDYLALKEDFDLEYALSQIFPKKQRELIFKKLRGERMTKTEKEYFSRSVKKKLIALANSDLHNLAMKILNN